MEPPVRVALSAGRPSDTRPTRLPPSQGPVSAGMASEPTRGTGGSATKRPTCSDRGSCVGSLALEPVILEQRGRLLHQYGVASNDPEAAHRERLEYGLPLEELVRVCLEALCLAQRGQSVEVGGHRSREVPSGSFPFERGRCRDQPVHRGEVVAVERQPDPGCIHDPAEPFHAQLVRFALDRCSLLILTEQGTGCRTHEQASGTPDAGCRQVFLDGGAQAGDERSDRLVLSQQLQELDLQSHGMKAVMREEPPAELVVDLDHPTGFRKTTAHGEQRGHALTYPGTG